VGQIANLPLIWQVSNLPHIRHFFEIKPVSSMPSPHCLIIDSPVSTVWSDPTLPESMVRGIAANPTSMIQAAAGQPVKISHESLIVEADWPAKECSIRVAVKQYLPRSLWKALTAICRPAKAMENWRKAEFLLAHGVATPRPLLACRPHGWAASSTSFLATEWIGQAENLHIFGWRIAKRPMADRLRLAARCAAALGRLLGRIHAAGAAHRDLKAANLLVVEESRDVTVHLVDLDGLQVSGPVGSSRKAHDLARLVAGLTAHPWVTRSNYRRFLRAYLAEIPPRAVDWKPLWRAIALDAAKYVARKRKRGQPVL
jgi:tRNA A-37 threonylcarbamoyl transferase component Bud32